MPSTDIEELLRLMARGDESALASLYDATRTRVFGLAVSMLRDRGEAEEATVAIYGDLWRRVSSFDAGRGSGVNWILLVARSRILDRIRSEGRVRARGQGGEDDVLERLASGNEPSQAASHGEERRKVRSAVAALPVEQRRPLLLAYFDGLSHSEVAARMEAPLGTVKSRIRAALESLRSRLNTRGEVA